MKVLNAYWVAGTFYLPQHSWKPNIGALKKKKKKKKKKISLNLKGHVHLLILHKTVFLRLFH